ncbi:RHS repeat domain-containing protein, partial [Pedobacter frigoris]
TAEGEKLQKKYVNGPVTMITAYNKGIEYVGRHVDTLQVQYIQTSEGRAWFDGTKFIYEYNLTDHLGNVRATIDADPADVTQRTARLVQENSYYPFGMVMPGADINYTAGNKNNYLYTGKEFQEELGEYDHGARFYDPAVARWSVADPLAEQFYGVSAYNYVFNNPMAFTDPTGMAPEGKEDPRGEWYRDMWYDPYAGGYYAYIHYNNEKEQARGQAEANHAMMAGARNARIQQRQAAYAYMWANYNPLNAELPRARTQNDLNQEKYSSNRGNFGNNANKQNGSWENSKEALDIGGGAYGFGENLFLNNGKWLGKNNKYYSTNFAGNQHTGSRNGVLKLASKYKSAGRIVTFLSVGVGVIETAEGFKKDGNKVGYNATRATASTLGSLAGGLIGAKVGAAGGGAIGIAFFGVGSVPGAVIGGTVGFVGGYFGGKAGGKAAEYGVDQYYKHK